jgi:ribosomal protein S18 acetylase RimI-like enzyme
MDKYPVLRKKMSFYLNLSKGPFEEIGKVDFCIREAMETDLPALEWEGEYERFRLVYHRAMKEAKKGRQVLLIADFCGIVVGQIFILLNTVNADPRPQPYTGYLYSFRVKSDYRNRGIGTSLIENAETVLLERSFRRVLIGVAKENQDARRLYQRHGYEIIADDPGEWSFIDHNRQIQHVVEPTFIMEKIF